MRQTKTMRPASSARASSTGPQPRLEMPRPRPGSQERRASGEQQENGTGGAPDLQRTSELAD